MVRNQVRLKITYTANYQIVNVPGEANDIQMTDTTEMPFLLAPVNEQEYQNMLNSIDYQLVHSTAPSQIHDIALTEESNTFPSDNDWMIVDEISSLEPVMSNVGNNPASKTVTGTWSKERFSALPDPTP